MFFDRVHLFHFTSRFTFTALENSIEEGDIFVDPKFGLLFFFYYFFYMILILFYLNLLVFFIILFYSFSFGEGESSFILEGDLLGESFVFERIKLEG